MPKTESMRLFNAAQMRAADQAAIDAGMPALLLMEQAGRAVAEALWQHWPQHKRVLLLCGKGNNGGDGYAAARHLAAAAWQVTLLELSDHPNSPESQQMRAAWLWQHEAYAQTTAHGVFSLSALQQALSYPEIRPERCPESCVVVDALFGSGLNRPLEGELAQSIAWLNRCGAPLLSVDVPSGISADSPQLLGEHIRAQRTVQLAAPKLASAFYPARAAFGSWQVAAIGIPEARLETHSPVLWLEPTTVAPWLPQRPAQAHKYQVGTVLVVAGSARYSGAALLSCQAALRAGAGLVTLASSLDPAHTLSLPELIQEPLAQPLQPQAALEQLAKLDGKRQQQRLIGPGLDAAWYEALPQLIASQPVPTVLDAGALQGSAAWFTAVQAQGQCVLTPHVGEAKALLAAAGLAEDPERQPLAAAQALAAHCQAVVVLKASSSVIASPDGRVAVSTSGHPGMATAGSGDVLAGVIAACLAGAEDFFTRTAAAVYWHGLAGECAAETAAEGLLASDICRHLGQAWRRLKL